MTIDDLKKLFEIIQAITTSLGIILAGIWSLWLFVFSRSFAGSLTINLSLKQMTKINDLPVAIIRVHIKNIGRTRIKKGYCLITAKPIDKPFPSENIYAIGTKALDYTQSQKIFESLIEVEPNEEVVEEIALAIGQLSFFKAGVKFKNLTTKETWESVSVFNVTDNDYLPRE